MLTTDGWVAERLIASGSQCEVLVSWLPGKDNAGARTHLLGGSGGSGSKATATGSVEKVFKNESDGGVVDERAAKAKENRTWQRDWRPKLGWPGRAAGLPPCGSKGELWEEGQRRVLRLGG